MAKHEAKLEVGALDYQFEINRTEAGIIALLDRRFQHVVRRASCVPANGVSRAK